MTARYWSAPVTPMFCVAFALWLAAVCATRARSTLLLCSVFFVGWLNYTANTGVISPFDIRRIVGDDARLVLARGYLCETPTQRVFVRDEEESWRTVVELELKEVQFRGGDWRPALGRVLAVTTGVLEERLFEKQAVEVRGILGRPLPPVAEGLFDFRNYLATKGISYRLKVNGEDQWRALGPRVPRPFAQIFTEWAQRTLARGLPGEDEALRLQWAMVLGWSTALNNRVSEPFMRSGTMHIFAISGLHITLIAAVFISLLRACAIPRFACGLIVLALIWFYTVATGMQASAVRSTVMSTIVILGWMLRRPGDLVNSLAAAALIILVFDPLQLFQASFQLSFFVVLSLALLVPLLDRAKQRVFKLDPLLPMELRPSWQLLGIKVGNWSWGFFSASLGAFLGSLPIIAYYFNLFTPGSLLANLLVVPASGAALMCGLGSLLTAAVAPPVAELFNHAGWFFMRLMMALSERAAELPGSCWHVRAPGLPEFLSYYTALLAALAGGFKLPRLRWVIVAVLAAFGGISVAGWWQRVSAAEISILPLQGSQIALVRSAWSAETWAINSGPHASFDLFAKPFLQSRGINRISRLVLARPDSQHNGALLDMQARFPINAISVTPQKPSSRVVSELLDEMKSHVPVRLDCTNGAWLGPFRVLHPAAGDRFKRAADGSVALLGSFEGVNVLLLSGLSFAGQNALFDRAAVIKADIVVTSGEPLAPALLARIEPKLIIVSETGLRSKEIRDRYAECVVPVLFMKEAGTVTIRMKNGRWRIATSMPQVQKRQTELTE